MVPPLLFTVLLLAVSQENDFVTAGTEAWDKLVEAQMKELEITEKKDMVDGDYILLGQKVKSQKKLTFWGKYETSSDGSLQLDHCRYGRSSDADRDRLLIALGTCFQLLDKFGYWYTYPCHQKPKLATIWLAKAVTCTDISDKEINIGRCHQNGASSWCGIPKEITENANCLADYSSLLYGRDDSEYVNGIQFLSKMWDEGRTIFGSFRCEKNKLILAGCNLNQYDDIKINPGEHLLYRGFYHICPKAKPLASKDEIKSFAHAFKTIRWSDAEAPKDSKERLPDGFDKGCSSGWASATQKGKLDFTFDGFVTILDHESIPAEERVKNGPKKKPRLLAKFVCDKTATPPKVALMFCIQEEYNDKRARKDIPQIAADECRDSKMDREGKLKGL